MKPLRPIYVLGGAHSPYVGRRHAEQPTLEQHVSIAARGALEVAGVEASAIDKGYIGNFLGELFCNQGHVGAVLAAAHPDFAGKPFARTEGACASGGLAVLACVEALHAGHDVCLAAGVEVETSAPGSKGVAYMARAAHWATQSELDPALWPYLFARRAKAYKERFGATGEDIGAVVAKAFANAQRNPAAQLRGEPVPTAQWVATASSKNREFLGDPELRPHMRLFECTRFGDGASAAVLANEEGLRKLGISKSQCTQILGYGHTVQPIDGAPELSQLSNLRAAAHQAYESAGVGPSDLGVVEVHDCFAVNELLHYEALDLCGAGEAPALLREGHTAIEGRIPVNTGGGLLGFGHPVGATGVRQVVEIWRQLQGRCGDYQVDAKLGLSANIGGDDRTGVVVVQELV